MASEFIAFGTFIIVEPIIRDKTESGLYLTQDSRGIAKVVSAPGHALLQDATVIFNANVVFAHPALPEGQVILAVEDVLAYRT